MADEHSADEDDKGSADRYPIECPSCRNRSAHPKGVSTVKGRPDLIRLDLLCGHCAHGWTLDKIDDRPE